MDDCGKVDGADAVRKQRDNLKIALPVLAIGLMIAGVVWLAGSTSEKSRQELVSQHAAAVLGIPIAMMLAFAVVAFLQQAEGPVEFDGLGFKFKGAAGEVVLWVITFLAIVVSIKALW